MEKKKKKPGLRGWTGGDIGEIYPESRINLPVFFMAPVGRSCWDRDREDTVRRSS
jgi:hypothetical protein